MENFNVEAIKDLTPEQIVTLANNSADIAIKTAKSETFKDALSNIDEVVTGLGFEKKEGEKTSDFASRVISSSIEANKTINTDLEKFKLIAESKDESEALKQVRLDLANSQQSNSLIKSEFETFKSNVESENSNRLKLESDNVIKSSIFAELNKGNYGDVPDSMKKSYLNAKVSEITSNYDIKRNSNGNIEFYDKSTKELSRTGDLNSPSTILDIALKNEDFKSMYSSESVQANNNLNLGGNQGNVSRKFKDAGAITEYVNTLKLPNSEKYAMISKLTSEL